MTDRKSILCPRCRKLISGYVTECPHCGLKKPGSSINMLTQFLYSGKSFVRLIIGVNVVFFILSFLFTFLLREYGPMGRGMMGIPGPSNVALRVLGWAEPQMVMNGAWWLLVTAMFLHGGILHIGFNMMWVRDLGPLTEDLLSPEKMLIIYILSGIGGNLASVMFSAYPVVGASGAVFGLMGAIIAQGKKRGGYLGAHLVRQLGVWAILMIAMGFIIPGVSNSAHIGGVITGGVLGLLMPYRDSALSAKGYRIAGAGILGICAVSFFMLILRLVELFM